MARKAYHLHAYTCLWDTGATALMIAASKGKLDVVVSLLGHGSDPLQKANDGSTAIEWALKFRHSEIADFLREHLSVSILSQ